MALRPSQVLSQFFKITDFFWSSIYLFLLLDPCTFLRADLWSSSVKHLVHKAVKHWCRNLENYSWFLWFPVQGVQVKNVFFRVGAADGTCWELTPGNPEAALGYSGLSEPYPSVSFLCRDEGEAGIRKSKHIWVIPAGGSEMAGAGTPTSGCTLQTYPRFPVSDMA